MPGYSPAFEQITMYPGRMAKAARASNLKGLVRQQKPWLNGLPRLISVSDLSDALAEVVSFKYLLVEIINVVTSGHGRRHLWLWLTKLPERMAEFSRWLEAEGIDWPENLWAGTSITTEGTTTRIEQLLEVGDQQTLRFVAIEPQWESVDLARWMPGIDWIIQGGEGGGSNVRRFQLQWAREMIEQCREGEVPLFIAQMGSYVFDGDERMRFRGNRGSEWREWPHDLRVRQLPAYVGGQPVPLLRQRRI